MAKPLLSFSNKNIRIPLIIIHPKAAMDLPCVSHCVSQMCPSPKKQWCFVLSSPFLCVVKRPSPFHIFFLLSPWEYFRPSFLTRFGIPLSLPPLDLPSPTGSGRFSSESFFFLCPATHIHRSSRMYVRSCCSLLFMSWRGSRYFPYPSSSFVAILRFEAPAPSSLWRFCFIFSSSCFPRPLSPSDEKSRERPLFPS